jgi:glycosyltransferase involved in cell wall biosynthesis
VNVSVVIPTYNGARFIREALESVFAQTLPPQEIIVVDDASTDATPDLVEEIAKTSPVALRMLRLVKNCGGPALPLNFGIMESSTELVALLEQDDLMAERRLEQQVQAAVRYPECGMVIGRPAHVIERDGCLIWQDCVSRPTDIPQFAEVSENESFVVPSETAFRSLMRANFIYSNSNVLMRKSVWSKVGGFDRRWRINSDADFEFRILLNGPIAVVNSIVCGYRYRPDSLYHSRYEQARIDGQLIRLKWGSHRWDWAAKEVQPIYWSLRSQAFSLLREGQLRRSLQILRAIIVSRAFRRHLLAKVGIGSF